jgi:hypothetical protein
MRIAERSLTFRLPPAPSVSMEGFRHVGRTILKRWFAAKPLHVPKLRFSCSGKEGGPFVYYVTPDDNCPSGGIRTIYRHVDILNSEGVNAAVVHHKRDFTCTWFPHQTHIAYADDICLTPEDIVVVPEIYGETADNIPRGVKRVIFNQGAYLTFARSTIDSSAITSMYLGSPDLAAVLVVSEDSSEYMRYAFQNVRVERIHQSIDPKIFYPSDAPAGRRIAFMPRRYTSDIVQVIQLLRARRALRDWDLVPIENSSPLQAAEQLRSAAIFLTLSNQEGFGIPPVEAMACGCLVAGFPGHGGREYFHHDWSFPVEQGDVKALSETVERLIHEFEVRPAEMRAMALRGAAYVKATYTPEQERADIMSFIASLQSNP